MFWLCRPIPALGEGVTCIQQIGGKLVRRESNYISDILYREIRREKGLWEFHISCSAYRLEPKMFTKAGRICSYIF